MNTLELHGRTFNIEKRNGEWQINYRDAKATAGSTKIEVIKALKAMDRDKLLSACDYHDKIVSRDVYFREHTNKFTTVFGFTPPRDFLLYSCGHGLSLDIIALDKKLRTPDGVSTNDYILKEYGQAALNMVQSMI